MRVSLLRYGAAAALVAAAAAGAGLGLSGGSRPSFWVGGALAVIVQAICFLGLWLGARRARQGFLAAWAGGILARLVAVLVFGVWGVEALGLRKTPALLAMVGVLFLLLVLEPVGFARTPGAARA